MAQKTDLLGALREALGERPLILSPDVAPARAAVAVVARESAGEPELLFIHRAEHPRDPWSGHMAFPGGRVDPRDADERAAVEREVEEEIGLRLQETAELLGRLHEIQARAREGRLPLGIAPFVYWLEQPAALRVSSEVQDVLWIPLLELVRPENRQSLDYAMGGQVVALPSIAWRGKVIWGLTLRILADLLDRLSVGSVGGWARDRLGLAPQQPLLPSSEFIARLDR
jgi:8-oxo-dGTP pyrophosphatase MutT (NUDIX family)